MDDLFEQKKLDQEDEMSGWERFRYNTGKLWTALRAKRPAVLLAALFIIILLVMALLLGLSQKQKAELLELQKQSEEQIDRQWLIIEGLRNQEKEASLIEEAPPVVTSDQLMEELGSIQELVTQQYIYTNADKIEQNETWIFGWDLPFSDKSLVVTYDGEIKAGVDLSQVEINVDEGKRTVTVTLPPSKITVNHIPQESITILQVKNGLFNKVTFDDYNDFISDQKIIMENKAVGRGLLEAADREAQTAVKSFLSAMPGMDAYTLTVETAAP